MVPFFGVSWEHLWGPRPLCNSSPPPGWARAPLENCLLRRLCPSSLSPSWIFLPRVQLWNLQPDFHPPARSPLTRGFIHPVWTMDMASALACCPGKYLAFYPCSSGSSPHQPYASGPS